MRRWYTVSPDITKPQYGNDTSNYSFYIITSNAVGVDENRS